MRFAVFPERMESDDRKLRTTQSDTQIIEQYDFLIS